LLTQTMSAALCSDAEVLAHHAALLSLADAVRSSLASLSAAAAHAAGQQLQQQQEGVERGSQRSMAQLRAHIRDLELLAEEQDTWVGICVACLRARMYARMQSRTHARARTRTRTRTHTHARMHARMHACLYVVAHARMSMTPCRVRIALHHSMRANSSRGCHFCTKQG